MSMISATSFSVNQPEIKTDKAEANHTSRVADFAPIVDSTTATAPSIVRSVTTRLFKARKPTLMARARVRPRRFIDGRAVMNGLPIIGRRVDRIDAERLNGIDELQHTLDLRTTGQPQQDLATRNKHNMAG